MKQKKIRLLVSLQILIISFFLTGIMASTAHAASKSEEEDNNTYLTANEISAGDGITGVIGDDKDTDFYKVTPTADGKLGISFYHNCDYGNDGWRVYLYHYSNGFYVEKSRTVVNASEVERAEIPFIGAVAGDDYYIRVEQYKGCVDLPYRIETSFVTSKYYEKEENDSYYYASKMDLNKSYYGVISNSVDYDYYRIESAAKGKLELNFSHDYEESTDSWLVDVYQYSGSQFTTLSSTYITLKEKDKKLPYIGTVEDGIYYIRVRRFYGKVIGVPYTIKPKFTPSDSYEEEGNDSYETATLIVDGKQYSGMIGSTEDSDYYKIVAPVTGTLSLTFQHALADPAANTSGKTEGWTVSIDQYADGTCKTLKYKKMNLASKSPVTIDAVPVKAKATYYIRVGSCASAVGISYDMKAGFKLSAMKSVAASGKKKSVKLSWKKNGTVDGYKIERKKGSKYVSVVTTKSTSYTVKKLSAKKKYTFRVRSFRKVNGVKYYSPWKTISAKTK